MASTGYDDINHSDSYHKFFHGYAERYVPKKNGKGRKIERIYVDDYYKLDVSDHDWKMRRISYWALFLGTGLLQGIGGSVPVAMNNALYIALPGIASILCWVILLGCLLCYTLMPRMMTSGDYNSNPHRLVCVARAQMIILWVIGFLSLIYLALHFKTAGILSVLSSACYFLAGAMAAGIVYLEKNSHYVKEPNPAKAPFDSVPIL